MATESCNDDNLFDVNQPRPVRLPPMPPPPSDRHGQWVGEVGTQRRIDVEKKWEDALAIWEATFLRHACILTLYHLQNAGVQPDSKLAQATSWTEFCTRLWSTLFPIFDATPDSKWLRLLLKDLVELCEMNSRCGHHMTELFGRNFRYRYQSAAPLQSIEAALPPSAQWILHQAAADRQIDAERLDMEGYGARIE